MFKPSRCSLMYPILENAFKQRLIVSGTPTFFRTGFDGTLLSLAPGCLPGIALLPHVGGQHEGESGLPYPSRSQLSRSEQATNGTSLRLQPFLVRTPHWYEPEGGNGM